MSSLLQALLEILGDAFLSNWLHDEKPPSRVGESEMDRDARRWAWYLGLGFVLLLLVGWAIHHFFLKP